MYKKDASSLFADLILMIEAFWTSSICNFLFFTGRFKLGNFGEQITLYLMTAKHTLYASENAVSKEKLRTDRLLIASSSQQELVFNVMLGRPAHHHQL